MRPAPSLSTRSTLFALVEGPNQSMRLPKKVSMIFQSRYLHHILRRELKKLKITAKKASSIALIDSGGVTFHVRIEASRALNFSGCDGAMADPPSLCRGFLSFMPQDERMQRAVRHCLLDVAHRT